MHGNNRSRRTVWFSLQLIICRKLSRNVVPPIESMGSRAVQAGRQEAQSQMQSQIVFLPP